MTIWTKGLIFGHVTPEQVAQALSEGYGSESVAVEKAHGQSHYIVHFKEREGDRMRAMSVFTENYTRCDWERLHDGDATPIMLADSGESRETIRFLVERFGGLFLETDCRDEDVWERFPGQGSSPAP